MAKSKQPIWTPELAKRGLPRLRKALPERVRPSIAQVRKEMGAKKASILLNQDGTLKPIPEVQHPFWGTLPDGTIQKQIWTPPTLAVSATPPAALQVYTPALPSDIGSNVVDFSKGTPSPFLWTWGDASAISNDVNQGSTGDCYFLAQLTAIALEHPEQRLNWITRNYFDNGQPTGFFDCKFYDDYDQHQYIVRVTGELSPWYCRPNALTGAIGCSIYEKAFAFARLQKNTYASINIGWMWDVLRELGWTPQGVNPYDANVIAILLAAFANKNPGTLGTNGNITGGASLIAGHAYTVYNIAPNGDATLINPWNFDGAGNDADTGDGWVVVPFDLWRQNCSGIVVGTNPPPVTYPPGDCNHDGTVGFPDLLQVANHFDTIVPANTLGDCDGDGKVTFKDLLIVANNFNRGN